MVDFELAERLNSLGSNKVGEAILFYREALGMTLANLAEKTGMSRQSISRYEKGKIRLNNKLQFLKKLACALGISLKDLLDRADKF